MASIFCDTVKILLMDFLYCRWMPQFTVTCADIKEVKTMNLKASVKKEDLIYPTIPI
jgi:hypothetical protein